MADVPKGAVFAPQPKSALGRPLTKVQRERLEKAYYERGTLGRDTMYRYLRSEYPDDPPIPRRAIQRWLNTQQLQQLYRQARKSRDTAPFKPTRPFHQLSIDLLDMTNKPAKNFRYIFNCVDNFSRLQFLRPITQKTPAACAAAFRKILAEIKSKYNVEPSAIVLDQGNEFLGEFFQLLKDRKITRKRTLAGSPSQNGLCERAGGRWKKWTFMHMRVHGGSWLDHLKQSLEVANSTWQRTTRFTPTQAATLNKEGRAKLRANVLNYQRQADTARLPDYPLGLAVRYRLNKGVLSKSTTPNWSERIFKIVRVINYPNSGRATKYVINRPRSADLKWGRHDLLPIIGEKPEPIPAKYRGGEQPEPEPLPQAPAVDVLPPKQKVAEQKKLADERLVASYVGKEVKTDQDGGDSGVIIAMVRRKVGKQRQWRIQVQWKKGGAKIWYPKGEIDRELKAA